MKKKTVKASDVFTLEAQIIADDKPSGCWEHPPCCPAIYTAGSQLGGRYLATRSIRDEFAGLFMPKTKATCDLWFGNTDVEKNQDRRILALLFMAEIAESEGN